MMARVPPAFVGIAFAACLCTACSIKRTAVDVVGDAISGGSGVYSSDADPDLVREALPFGLKTYESLLAVDPDHQGLLLAAANGFVGYGYILGQEADRLEATDLAGARALRARASKLFLRGRDYALRGLDVAHPGFAAAFARDRTAALAMTRKPDARLLYWAGAGWAGALGTNKRDPQLIADLPAAGALVARVLELDEAYDAGSAHEFFVTYEGSRPGGSAAEARRHYARALELSQGNRASVYLSLAEAVCVHEQSPREFRELIGRALAVDPDRVPELRLVNALAIRRAQWLETRMPDLFVTAELTE
jgi:predicted anti-sigma-YlaC factor YlaD